jgi:hypothetical protein
MAKKKKTEAELLEICRSYSGEYIPPGHPKTTFATTYSNQFVEAAAELYQRYHADNPRTAINRLYVALRDAKIPSCRGGVMTFSKVEYLVKRPIGSYLYRKATQ